MTLAEFSKKHPGITKQIKRAKAPLEANPLLVQEKAIGYIRRYIAALHAVKLIDNKQHASLEEDIILLSDESIKF